MAPGKTRRSNGGILTLPCIKANILARDGAHAIRRNYKQDGAALYLLIQQHVMPTDAAATGPPTDMQSDTQSDTQPADTSLGGGAAPMDVSVRTRQSMLNLRFSVIACMLTRVLHCSLRTPRRDRQQARAARAATASRIQHQLTRRADDNALVFAPPDQPHPSLLPRGPSSPSRLARRVRQVRARSTPATSRQGAVVRAIRAHGTPLETPSGLARAPDLPEPTAAAGRARRARTNACSRSPSQPNRGPKAANGAPRRSQTAARLFGVKPVPRSARLGVPGRRSRRRNGPPEHL